MWVLFISLVCHENRQQVLNTDKPHRCSGLSDANPTAHFALPYTLQVNHRPLPTGFSFIPFQHMMRLLCNEATKPQGESS